MARCLSQIKLKSGITVPCGKCYDCKRTRASAWSFRLMQEYKQAKTAYFITFTYDTDHVPLTKNGFMSLDKRDFQLFMKRLRKISDEQLKYYCVGEYGGKFGRPHFHAIMFNVNLVDLIGEKFAKQIELGHIPLDGKSIFPCTSWGKGNITIGKLSDASVGYTLKYISKDSKIGKFERDDRQKEFSLMSKGIGKNYLTREMRKWHKADLLNRMYCNVQDKKVTMPRYYKEKIYTKHERQGISNHLITKEVQDYQKLSTEQRRQESEKIYSQQIRKSILLRNQNSSEL